MKSKIKNHIDQNFQNWLADLEDLVRIPSVSFPNFPAEEVERCANAVETLLTKLGWNHVQQIKHKDSAPFLYADLIRNPTYPTVLLYAHYDVQPPMREELWNSPAFEPTVRDGRMYGRGAADDKAGVFIHAHTAHILQDLCPDAKVNLKIIFEGEEEVASPGLSDFVAIHKELLQADLLVVADLANFDTGYPSLTTSLRGMTACEITLKTLKSPLHSGLWSGPLPDAAALLTILISRILDEKGKILIPEMYEDLILPTKEELQDWQTLNPGFQEFASQAGLLPEAGLTCKEDDILPRLWREPSLTVSTIQAGERKNAGNVLMDSAWARLGLRLAPGMNAAKSRDLLKAALLKHCPDNCKLEIEFEEGDAEPWISQPDPKIFQVIRQALEDGYDHQVAVSGCGATIPFVGELCETLGGIPALLTGVEDPYSQAHGENESVHLGDLQKALTSQVLFCYSLGNEITP